MKNHASSISVANIFLKQIVLYFNGGTLYDELPLEILFVNLTLRLFNFKKAKGLDKYLYIG